MSLMRPSLVAMTSNLLAQCLDDSTVMSALEFFVIPTSLNVVDNTSVTPALSTGSRHRRKQPAHNAAKRSSNTCSTKDSNVKLMSLKFDAPNREWAVHGWENSAVYKLTLILTKAVNMQMYSAATSVGQ